MSNTITKRTEYPNESRQDAVERLRRGIRVVPQPPITGTTVFSHAIDPADKAVNFELIGHCSISYMKQVVQDTKQAQIEARRPPAPKRNYLNEPVKPEWRN